ncbi:MAG: hypothetical protein RLZZ628_3337 [Bacteroidota bacterium]|jgi:AAA15 family ATPase/GTPase
MLVQYSVENYKIFEQEAKISFVASNYYHEREPENVVDFPHFGLRLLKSAVIYGANASGKSKLFESMRFAKGFILSSSKDQQVDELIPIEPFKFSTQTIDAPSVFEFIFIHNEYMYRYGFEITKEKVISEWLYVRSKLKETELFFREEQDFKVNFHYFKIEDLIERQRIRPNALLLSTAAFWNDKLAVTLLGWFRNQLNVISGLREQHYIGYSMGKLQDLNTKNEILKFIKDADLGIYDLSPQKLDVNQLPIPQNIKTLLAKKKEETPDLFFDVITEHRKFNNLKMEVEKVYLSMDEDESSGTRKYFALSGPILETLKKGETLIIDEMDAKLHPNLTRKLIGLFNSAVTNPHQAQLLFNTHDTNLLDIDLFRRDQIWFVNKDRYGAACIYALSDMKGIRKDDPIQKNYLEGIYGGVPFLGDFNALFKD